MQKETVTHQFFLEDELKFNSLSGRATQYILIFATVLNSLIGSEAIAAGAAGSRGILADWWQLIRPSAGGRNIVREALEEPTALTLQQESAVKLVGRRSLSEILKYTDSINAATGGLVTDFSQIVREKYFVEVLGRDSVVREYLQQLASVTTDVVVLRGKSGVGRTHLSIAAQAQVELNRVVPALKDMQIFGINMNHVASLDPEVLGKVMGTAYENHLKKNDKGGMIVLHLSGLQRLVTHDGQESKKSIDIFIDSIKRAFPNRQVRIVLEGSDNEVRLLEKSSGYLSRAATIDVVELDETTILELSRKIATLLTQETKYTFSDNTLITLNNWLDLYLPGHGRPAMLMKIMPQIAAYKADKVFHTNSPLSEILRAKKITLERELNDFSEIEAEALKSNRPVGAFAAERLAKIRGSDGELAKIKQEIGRLDENFNNFISAAKRKADLAEIQNKRQLTAAEQQELDRVTQQVNEIGREEVAVIIQKESKVSFEEILSLDVLRNAAQRAEKARSLYVGQPELLNIMIEVGEKLYNPVHVAESGILEFLFIYGGPGTGKSYWGKVFSRVWMGREAHIQDFGKLKNEAAVTEFVGAPPGYIGSDRGSRLVEASLNQPRATWIFDEMARADKGVHDALLQPANDGVMTDGLGRTANLEQNVWVGSSNTLEDLPYGTSEVEAKKLLIKRDVFPAALVNRMRVVQARPLTSEIWGDFIKKRMQLINDALASPRVRRHATLLPSAEKEIMDRLLEAKNTTGVEITARDVKAVLDRNIYDRMMKLIRIMDEKVASIEKSGFYQDANKIPHEVNFKKGDTLLIDYNEAAGFVFSIAR